MGWAFGVTDLAIGIGGAAGGGTASEGVDALGTAGTCATDGTDEVPSVFTDGVNVDLARRASSAILSSSLILFRFSSNAFCAASASLALCSSASLLSSSRLSAALIPADAESPPGPTACSAADAESQL